MKVPGSIRGSKFEPKKCIEIYIKKFLIQNQLDQMFKI